jgi:hypothetical protein
MLSRRSTAAVGTFTRRSRRRGKMLCSVVRSTRPCTLQPLPRSSTSTAVTISAGTGGGFVVEAGELPGSWQQNTNAIVASSISATID